jgi:hypothetical protein
MIVSGTPWSAGRYLTYQSSSFGNTSCSNESGGCSPARGIKKPFSLLGNPAIALIDSKDKPFP